MGTGWRVQVAQVKANVLRNFEVHNNSIIGFVVFDECHECYEDISGYECGSVKRAGV